MKRFLAILLALGMLAACGSPAAPPGLENTAGKNDLLLQPLAALQPCGPLGTAPPGKKGDIQVEEKLKELHKAALERGCPFRAVETREEYLALFPPAESTKRPEPRFQGSGHFGYWNFSPQLGHRPLKATEPHRGQVDKGGDPPRSPLHPALCRTSLRAPSAPFNRFIAASSFRNRSFFISLPYSGPLFPSPECQKTHPEIVPKHEEPPEGNPPPEA